MIAPSYRVLETVRRVAPLGLVFRDPVGGRVSEGLRVRVHALVGAQPGEAVEASANRTGVFVAQGLPGLEAYEAGPDDEGRWEPGPARPFLLEVWDAYERYLPFVLRVDAPSAQREVLLFGTPARPLPAGMAVVRATLVLAESRAPAACAVLEVWGPAGELLGRGISDQGGETAVPFAYPEPPAAEVASPPDAPHGGGHGALSPLSPPDSPPSAAQPLAEQRWGLGLRVRYQGVPGVQLDTRPQPLPDLEAVLQQSYANFAASPPAAELPAELLYGEELVLGGETLISPA